MVKGRNRLGVRRAGELVPCRVSRGFTLLELMLVMGIVAILVTIALPRFGAAGSRYQADLAARRLVQDLVLAQSTAKAKSAAQTVTINPDTDQVILLNATALDPHTSAYITSLSDRPYQADITLSDFNGDNSIVFNGWGLPDSNGTATLSVGTETRTVLVDAETGKASIE